MISDVPGGSGLSSSACFEVLLGTVVNGLFCESKLDMAEIAKIGQYAENVYFGKQSSRKYGKMRRSRFDVPRGNEAEHKKDP